MKNIKTGYLLTINSGSSSLKFSLFERITLALELSGTICELRPGDPHMTVKDGKGKVIISHAVRNLTLANAEKEVISFLHDYRTKYPVTAIGHRVVQGGPDHRQCELISPALLKELRRLEYLAPNHLPNEIALIKTFGEAFSDAVQVACFDTFFHRELPAYASTYALPAEYREKGLMRYGFHGLSYESIMDQLCSKHKKINKKKIIIAHLGSGASMAAVKDGRGADTTMGVSPLGGLVMSTRPGDLDPGVILFLLRQHQLTVPQLDDLLSHSSGLKALAGTGDMAVLTGCSPDNTEAQAAIDLFCYQARKQVGALAAAIGGLDLLVFTGGIGENSPTIRAEICEHLGFLGIKIDRHKNNKGNGRISVRGSGVRVMVLAADEAAMIARHTRQLTEETHS